MRIVSSIFVIAAGLMLILAVSEVHAGASISNGIPDQSIVVDGDAPDWEGVELHYFEEGIRTVGVTHDADHLYVMWRFGDERLARRVLARGVTVWVNGDGKKKEIVGIRYPGSKLIVEALPPLESEQLPSGIDEGQAGRMRHEFTVCDPGVVTIFDGEVEIDLPEENENGPVAASAIHDGVFVYEMRIPFTTIGGEVASEAATDQRKVAVGLQVGGLSPAEQEAMQEKMREKRLGDGMGGGMGGGMSGRGGGGMGPGMGGGRPGGPSGGRTRMGDQEIEWLKIKLLPVADNRHE